MLSEYLLNSFEMVLKTELIRVVFFVFIIFTDMNNEIVPINKIGMIICNVDNKNILNSIEYLLFHFNYLISFQMILCCNSFIPYIKKIKFFIQKINHIIRNVCVKLLFHNV